MKVILCDDSHYEIFLNHFYNKDVDMKDKDSLENYFKTIFEILHKDYHMDIHGYYDIHVYHDTYYGMVLEMEKEDIDYYEFSMNEVDMRIQIEKESEFLYQVEDIFVLPKEILEKSNIYSYKDSYFLLLKKELDAYEFAYLLENSELYYQNTNVILKKGKLLH